MKTLKNKNILLCVTGSIAAYKACELLRLLRKEEVNVQVMMRESAEKFVGQKIFKFFGDEKFFWRFQKIFLCKWTVNF